MCDNIQDEAVQYIAAHVMHTYNPYIQVIAIFSLPLFELVEAYMLTLPQRISKEPT